MKKSPITSHILEIESKSVLGLDGKVGMGVIFPKSNLNCDLSLKVKHVGQRENYHKKMHNSLNIGDRELACIAFRSESGYGYPISKVKFD